MSSSSGLRRVSWLCWIVILQTLCALVCSCTGDKQDRRGPTFSASEDAVKLNARRRPPRPEEPGSTDPNLELRVATRETALASSTRSKPEIALVNVGQAPLKDFVVQYFIKTERAGTPRLRVLDAPHAKVRVRHLRGKEYLVELAYRRFTLQPGETLSSRFSLRHRRASAWNKTNDRSNTLSEDYVQTENILVRDRRGRLIYGNPAVAAGHTIPAPTDLVVEAASAESFTLSWQDNSNDENGFTAQNSLDGVHWDDFAQLDANTTFQTFALAGPSVTVFFRVRANRSDGFSDYSNIAPYTVSGSNFATLTPEAGGALSLPGVAELTVPANALSEAIAVSLVRGVRQQSIAGQEDRVLNPEAIELLELIDITHNAVSNAPMTLTMHYDAAALERVNQGVLAKIEAAQAEAGVDLGLIARNVKETDLDIFYFDPETATFRKTFGTVSAANDTISSQTPYLGIYAIGFSYPSQHAAEPSLESNGLSGSESLNNGSVALSWWQTPPAAHPPSGSTAQEKPSAAESTQRTGSSSVTSANLLQCLPDIGDLFCSYDFINAANPDGYGEGCNLCPKHERDIDSCNSSCGNGCDYCSFPGGWIDQSYGGLFSTSCAKHDCCFSHGWSTYNWDQGRCDREFLSDLLMDCERGFPYRDQVIRLSYPCVSSSWDTCTGWFGVRYPCLRVQVNTCSYDVVIPDLQGRLDRAICNGVAHTMQGVVSLIGDGSKQKNISSCFDYLNQGKSCTNCVVNKAPTLTAVYASSNSTFPGSPVTLTAVANDADCDALSYQWTSSCPGTFGNANAAITTWTPDPLLPIPTTCTLTVSVSDGNASASQGLAINVEVPPVMDVTEGLSAVPHFSSYDFGFVPVNGSSEKVFTIRNTGSGPLELKFVGAAPLWWIPTVAVTLSSDDVTAFAVTAQPPPPPVGDITVVPAGGSVTFKLAFQPTLLGDFNAAVEIAGNDPNRSPYVFTVRGTSDPLGAKVLDLPFNSATNPTPDISGYNNAGTVIGADFLAADGVCASAAYEFSWAARDSIAVPHHSSLDASAALSVEAWIYPYAWDNTFAGYNRIVSKQPVYLLRGVNGHLQFQVSTNGQGFREVTSPTPISVNQWHHVVGTFDGQRLKLFVNGLLVASRTLAVADTLTPNSGPLEIGESGSLNEGFSGRIDNARVYRRTLNASEIADTYLDGGCQSSTILDLGFETSNVPTPDSSSYEHDGTVVDAAYRPALGACSSNAYEFSWAAQDRIEVPYQTTQDVSSGLTVEAWVRPYAWDNTLAGYNRIVSKQPVYLLRGAAGQAQFQVQTTTYNFRGVLSPGVLSLNTWHYLVGTFDGQTVRLFVDGNLVATDTLPTPDTLPLVSSPISIGESAGLNEGFTGIIDGIRVRTRAITPTEVTSAFISNGCSN